METISQGITEKEPSEKLFHDANDIKPYEPFFRDGDFRVTFS